MRHRVLTPELMDDAALAPDELRAALAGLRRLNAASLCAPLLWRLIKSEAIAAARPIRVLDVACADGAWVIDAASRARAIGLRADFDGCDINPVSIGIAEREAASRKLPCSFFVHDAIRGEVVPEYDVIVASLFLHHLTDAEAEALLSRMYTATKRLVVVNDLVRSRWNLLMVSAACRLLTRSEVVHTDAVRSTRAAFTRRELLMMAERAGMRGATIGFGGIGRMMLVYRRRA